MYQYKFLPLTGNNKIPNDIQDQLNDYLLNNPEYKVHSVTDQGYSNNTYWKTFLLEKQIKQ